MIDLHLHMSILYLWPLFAIPNWFIWCGAERHKFDELLIGNGDKNNKPIKFSVFFLLGPSVIVLLFFHIIDNFSVQLACRPYTQAEKNQRLMLVKLES